MSKKSREWKMEAKYHNILGFKKMYSLKRYKEKKRIEKKMQRRMTKDVRNFLSKNKWGYSGGQWLKAIEYWSKQTAFVIQLITGLEERGYTPEPGLRISINGKQILPQM